MMVNAYKESKKMSIGMYYSKDYFSRRWNDCYTYNKYKGYNYYYKLHNHGKMVGSEVQDGQKGREKEKGEERDGKRNVEKEEGHNKKIVYVKNNGDNSRRMSKGCKEKENVEAKEKKTELDKKKCIIKILKRPTVVAKNETNVSKPVGGGNTNNGSTNVEKEKHNSFMNGELKKDVEDAKKEKSGKKKAASKFLTKEKKNKDGFKFTSTQELFNLLLKDVKEDNTASNEEETLLTRSDMMDSTKKRSNQSKTELNNKVVRMKTETKNDEEEGEKKNKKKKITKEGVDSRRKYDGNNAIGICMIGEKDDGVKKANGNGEGRQGAETDKVIALRGSRAPMVSSNSGNNGGGKCYTQKKAENNSVVNGKKILKLLKGMESNKCYATKKAVGGGENNYVKFSSSNYPSSVSNSSLPKHVSKVDLCKSSSLKNGDLKKIKKEEEEGLFVIPLYMRSPKPEQIPIPVYLSEDVLKRVENVEGGESASGSNGREEKLGGSFPETNVHVFLDRDNSVGMIGGEGEGSGGMAPVENSPSKMHKDKATMSQIGKAKNYGKIVRDTVNLNLVNSSKEKEIGLNFAKRNAEKKKKKTYLSKKYQHISFNLEHNNLKLNYDVLDLGNVKSSNRGYNVHSTSPYGKTSNYNYGCNLHKSGKNFKVDKYFYNRKYKLKTAYLSDGQRSKNFYLLKNVKIAAY
ncbi:conserved Plasmodium protein, unknown function [Plasmodium ovale curtisi]|uniref:Uncharacterized protein n=1 Tax=Plasmodium ovale curtisi TaxID=864141 RepID=A0A1A8VRA3_PLAOA|nr:conserved Plasmodium protein, unknown function [Plasmodium ovale curtisi]